MFSTSEKFGVAGALLIVGLWLAAIYGYVANIIKMIGLLDGGFSAWLVARAVGAVAVPLGAILGFF